MNHPPPQVSQEELESLLLYSSLYQTDMQKCNLTFLFLNLKILKKKYIKRKEIR